MQKTAKMIGLFFERAIGFFLIGIIVASLVCAAYCLLFYPIHYPNIFSFKEMIFSLPAALIMITVFFVGRTLRQFSDKWLIFLFSCVEIILACLLIFSYDTKPVVDYAEIWDAAIHYASGDYSISCDPSHYTYMYNWQIGMAFFESLIIRVFGPNFVVLKFVSVFITIATDICMFILVKRKINRDAAVYVLILSVLYMPWVLSIPQLTNHHVAILLAFLVFRFLDTHRPIRWLIAGLLTAILNTVRAYGIIIFLSAVCLFIYNLMTLISSPPHTHTHTR